MEKAPLKEFVTAGGINLKKSTSKPWKTTARNLYFGRNCKH
jgi:hypothetical protein